LDLSLRQGLEPKEIAGILGASAGTVYTRLSRLKDALEASVSALILYRSGRRECRELSDLIERYGGELTARLRKAINRHLAGCSRCQESRRRFVAAGALYGAVPPFTAPAEVREGILAAVLEAVPAGATATSGATAASRSGTLSGSGPRARPRLPRWVTVAAAGALVAGIAAAGWRYATLAPEGGPPPPADDATPAPPTPELAGPAPAITRFAVRDTAADRGAISGSLELAVIAEATGEPVAWLVAEGVVDPPAADDPRWQTAPPRQLRLAPGDGRRAVYLWVRDGAGRTAVARAEILVDTTPPGPPTGLRSSSHVPGEATTRNVVTVRWDPPADAHEGSGLAGYAHVWDNPGELLPEGLTLGPEVTSVQSMPLAPGRWYFLIRAVDRAGNAGPVARLGPFVVVAPAETPPPPAPEVEQPPVAPPPVEPPPPVTAKPALSIRRFALSDPELDTPGLTSRLQAAVDAEVQGEARAFLVAEDRPEPPAASDPLWRPALPSEVDLGPGEGVRTLYLWVQDASGRVVGAVAELRVDTVAPGPVLELSSPTHPAGAVGGKVVEVQWQPAADPEPGCGIAAYELRWLSEHGDEAAVQVLDGDATSATSPELAPGAWYLEIRAQDAAGHAGKPSRWGPFVIGD
ncbi:MAG TPA: hypothetical protein VF282_01420, partial [Bacillota bacterium]